MIVRVQALGFRSLRYVDQELDRFQVLVGPNGAGKSSFLDVIAFAGDVLRVGPLKAIRGDVRMGVSPRSADPRALTWMGQGERFELAVELRIPRDRAGRFSLARYEIAVRVAEGEEVRLETETLWLKAAGDLVAEPAATQRVLFPQPLEPPEGIVRGVGRKTPADWRKVIHKVGDSGNDYFQAETSNWNNQFRLAPSKSALANLPEDESKFPVATWVKRFLMEGVQRVSLNAEAMRSPSPPGSPRTFLPDGSNLPWVVDGLRADPARFERWTSHIRSALPDVRSVETVERPEDRHRYLVVEYANGLRAPSWVVSDGTLRLLALTLPAFLPQMDGVLLVEEPENGIHPRAVETVYQALSAVDGVQILCASHSPVVLGMAQPRDLLCFAKDDLGASDIVRGNDHPVLREWQGALDLSTLFASGVLG